MPGIIALVGGYAFRTKCRGMDQAILARVGTSARILVLPTAAAFESPRQAAHNGVQHLRRPAWNAPRMAETASPGVTVVGVDVATALVLPDQLVLGEGEVTVYTPEPATYPANVLAAQSLL